MTEYPVNCSKCGKYLGTRHFSEWGEKDICDECWDKEHTERQDYQKFFEEDRKLHGPF